MLLGMFFPLCLREASLNRLIQAGESITFASLVCIFWALLWKKKKKSSNSCSFHNELVQNKCIIWDYGYLIPITQSFSLVAMHRNLLHLIYCLLYYYLNHSFNWFIQKHWFFWKLNKWASLWISSFIIHFKYFLKYTSFRNKTSNCV